MIGTATDSIVTGQKSQKSKDSTSVGSKIRRGIALCTSGTPSIPSRYLTIVTSNSEKRGFQQTSKRFQSDLDFTPGPAQYDTVIPLSKQLEKTSDSKKGTGTFASKSKREGFLNTSKHVPAPTSYNLAGLFGNDHHDFNRAKYSSMFQKSIIDRPLTPKSWIPPANSYDIQQGLNTITKSNNVSAQSAFRSNTKRSFLPDNQLITPAPGAYDLKNLTEQSSRNFYESSFKSSSKRDPFTPARSTQSYPGPADYRPYDKMTEKPHRQLFPRQPPLTISAPALPPSHEQPHPGPGAYELRDFKEAEKKFMSSAVFVSSTSRWTDDVDAIADEPGPGSYTPRWPTKQSFNFNFERKWLA